MRKILQLQEFQGVGATVTITGIVTNGDELGPIRYIEDALLVLAIYDFPTTNTYLNGVVRGDEYYYRQV